MWSIYLSIRWPLPQEALPSPGTWGGIRYYSSFQAQKEPVNGKQHSLFPTQDNKIKAENLFTTLPLSGHSSPKCVSVMSLSFK